MNVFRGLFLALMVIVPFAIGCGGPTHPPTKRAQVSGKITVDSKPLTTGTITFDPGSGDVPAALNILDGSYEGKAPVGKNTVRISATRKISMKEKMKGLDGPGYDQMVEENMLPPRYHNDSKIVREVDEKAENKFNFDLLTK